MNEWCLKATRGLTSASPLARPRQPKATGAEGGEWSLVSTSPGVSEGCFQGRNNLINACTGPGERGCVRL